jgi:signal transduction histidine kinase
VDTLLGAAVFVLPIIQKLALMVRDNKITIDLLSFVVAGLASLMMWLAYRRIRSEKWVMYFAVTFGALSANFLSPYLLKLFTANPNLFVNSILRDAFSTLSNVFGVAAALNIQNRRSLFPQNPRDSAPIRATTKWDSLLPPLCWVLVILSVIAIPIKYPLHVKAISKIPYPQTYDILLDSPDKIFSTLCLMLMGYAIFANLGTRQYRVLAPLALIIIAALYASVQLAYAFRPVLANYFVADSFEERVELVGDSMIAIALPLKFCLCLFAYLLVVRFFEILSELGKLQDSEFERRQDYLASDGVVEWIGKELSDKALKKGINVPDGKTPLEEGFVNLVVKLPGETNRRVACIVWPNYEKDKRPRILDWVPGEKRFSPLSLDTYPERTKLLEWETLLPIVSGVLTDERQSESVWVKDQHQSQAILGDYAGKIRAVVSVAIRVNGAAVGCLQIARSDSPFSQMAIRQIRKVAGLLSSAVQSYRELAGLDLMSINFAKKQSEESPCSPEMAVEEIGTILHDIFAATVTRLHMDFGFSTSQVIYKTNNDAGHIKEKIEKETLNKKWEDLPPIISDYLPVSYKLLKKQLTARVTQTFGDKPLYKKDRFIMGNLLFVVDAEKDRYDHAALGINYLHRKTASTLAADAYLDFTRDYYGDVLKTLGRELSAKRLNFEEWFKPIQKVLTKQAGFTWVVVRQRRRKACFGDEEGLLILQRIKSFKHQVKTRRFNSKESPQIRTQYYLDNSQANSNNILKLKLSSSEGFIWLGVQRPGFGPELDFPSPWKTFLVNFTQIADASLSRITLPERFKEHVEAAQLQGIIASVATTGTMIHQFSNMIAGQLTSINTLRTAIDLGDLKTEDKEYKDILRAMNDSAASMLQLFQSFSNLTKTDDHQPCRLVDAARHAFKLFEVSLIPRGIRREIDIGEDIFVNVSFNVAALALATLVGNSKDAIKDDGLIRIEATEQGDTVVCHVIDNGRGITPETQKRIFEPKASMKEYGTGMGLYLTSHSLSENESSIELIKSDENGSKFTIRFPAAKRS